MDNMSYRPSLSSGRPIFIPSEYPFSLGPLSAIGDFGLMMRPSRESPRRLTCVQMNLWNATTHQDSAAAYSEGGSLGWGLLSNFWTV